MSRSNGSILAKNAGAFCRQWNMLPDGGLVLCAVSGGADSMCLLSWMAGEAARCGFTVAAAHYNHGLRGEAADRDEAFVKNYCEEHDIPFYAGHGDVAAAAQANGWSVEEAGRNLRYAFLNETAEKTHAVRVATAHNRGDNAETVLMNLVRGTGLTGLTGIAPVRGIYIRPLLDVSREEIEAYLAERGISYVQDESNDALVYTRNRIRHEVLPLLAELNPRIEETLNKTARLLREDDDYLSRTASRVAKSAARSDGEIALSRGALTELPAALQSRVVRRMLDLLGASKKDVTVRHIRAILDLVQKSGPTAQLSLPRGLVAENDGDRFRLRLTGGGEGWSRTALPPVGEVSVGPWRIVCRVTRETVPAAENRLILNNGALSAPVSVDRWRENARMTLPGREGSRSLKRLFVDAGFSVRRRENAPVIYVGARCAAALGVGVDRDFAENEREWNYVLDFYKR